MGGGPPTICVGGVRACPVACDKADVSQEKQVGLDEGKGGGSSACCIQNWLGKVRLGFGWVDGLRD